MKKIAIIGAGGLAKEYIEVAAMLDYSVYGLFAKENQLANIPYLGYLDELLECKENFDGVAIAVGAVNTQGIINRKVIIDYLFNHGIPQITLISPKTTLSDSVKIGVGVYIHHLATISCDAQIGNYTIINTAAIIGHDVCIGENCTISPSAFIGGGTVIGKNTLIGAGAIIKQGITIGEGCIIGMGTVVQRSIANNKIFTHNLTKPLSIN